MTGPEVASEQAWAHQAADALSGARVVQEYLNRHEMNDSAFGM